MAENKSERGARYWVWRISKLFLITYMAVLGFLYIIQRMMIFPGHDTQGQASSQVRPTKGSELVELATRDGDKVVALFGAALTKDGKPLPEANTRPTVIYFYGNGMCLNDCEVEFKHFRQLGVNVIIPDYVGYGMSSGKPSEAHCYATADAVYDHLLTRKDINNEKIVAAGWSLGSAVAIDLAARRPTIGLAAFSGFTSIKDMAGELYRYLPIPGFILQHRFESKSKIPSIKAPIFFGHGKRDSLIPWGMSAQMAASAVSPVTTFWVENADHADFFDTGGDKFLQAFGEFLQKL